MRGLLVQFGRDESVDRQWRGDSGIAVECFRMLDGAGNWAVSVQPDFSVDGTGDGARCVYPDEGQQHPESGSKCHRHGAEGRAANSGGGGFTEGAVGVCVI